MVRIPGPPTTYPIDTAVSAQSAPALEQHARALSRDDSTFVHGDARAQASSSQAPLVLHPPQTAPQQPSSPLAPAPAADVQPVQHATRSGAVFTEVTSPTLGKGWRDDTGRCWFILQQPDGTLVEDDAAGAAYQCHLRGGVAPPRTELQRLAAYFGHAVEGYQAPAWFKGLGEGRFWSCTPYRSSRPSGHEAPFDDMWALDGAKGWTFATHQAGFANVICQTL
jgi:hypothetical protein